MPLSPSSTSWIFQLPKLKFCLHLTPSPHSPSPFPTPSSWNLPMCFLSCPTFYLSPVPYTGFPGGRICLQCRRPGFNPWVRKIPWRRKWQPTPVFSLPGESRGQRSLVGYSPWGCKELDMTEWLIHFSALHMLGGHLRHATVWEMWSWKK